MVKKEEWMYYAMRRYSWNEWNGITTDMAFLGSRENIHGWTYPILAFKGSKIVGISAGVHATSDVPITEMAALAQLPNFKLKYTYICCAG